MKKSNALICHQILVQMLQEKMTVSTAMSISKVLNFLDKVKKDHDEMIESTVKTIEGFDAYRSARQAIIANAQRNQGNRQIQMEASEKLRELDADNPKVVEALRELDLVVAKNVEEEIEHTLPKLELPPDMQIEGSRLVELARAGLF